MMIFWETIMNDAMARHLFTTAERVFFHDMDWKAVGADGIRKMAATLAKHAKNAGKDESCIRQIELVAEQRIKELSAVPAP